MHTGSIDLLLIMKRKLKGTYNTAEGLQSKRSQRP